MEHSTYWLGDLPLEYNSNESRRIGEGSVMMLSANGGLKGRSSCSEWSQRASGAEYEAHSAGRRASGQLRSSRWLKTNNFPIGTMAYFLTICLCVVPTSAVLLRFENCLNNEYIAKTPKLLQFVPKFLDAVFDTSNSDHNLNITVWGNVTGTGPEKLIVLPPQESDYWTSNQTNLGGKIMNQPDETYNFGTTLFNKINVLTYQPWEENDNFCERMLNQPCPVAPVFNPNAYVTL